MHQFDAIAPTQQERKERTAGKFASAWEVSIEEIDQYREAVDAKVVEIGPTSPEQLLRDAAFVESLRNRTRTT